MTGNWHILCPIEFLGNVSPCFLHQSRSVHLDAQSFLKSSSLLCVDSSGRPAVVCLAARNFLFIIKVKDVGVAQASFLLSHGTEILVRSTMLAGSEVAFSAIYVLQDH